MQTRTRISSLLAVLALLLSACLPEAAPAVQPSPTPENIPVNFLPEITPQPTRPAYGPGELVDYIAQTGDTLPALAARFNTTIAEIRTANPILPDTVTTMPPGLPMKIPIYYLPLWGTPYQIIPDSLFIDGPAQVDFDTAAFLSSQIGWLNGYHGNLGIETRSAAEIIDTVALNYSVSPRLLLALLEYQAGGLSQPEIPASAVTYPLGYPDRGHRGLYMQLGWAANTLNNIYYGYRSGQILSFTHPDGRVERPDPWQNAATIALQVYFSKLLSRDAYPVAVSEAGLAQIYTQFFGDPWAAVEPHIPGSLYQPEFRLPFQMRKIWAFTGGPHTGWGEGEPLAALDFAPPSVAGGCQETPEWATAVASGVIARAENGLAVLDLDGDGDERTGWTVFYLHLDHQGRLTPGMQVQAGDALGHPSCERGRSTGTHVHIARKYNGEWIMAAGPLAFNLEGWLAFAGSTAYEGTLVRYDRTVRACTCSDSTSHIQSAAVQTQ